MDEDAATAPIDQSSSDDWSNGKANSGNATAQDDKSQPDGSGIRRIEPVGSTLAAVAEIERLIRAGVLHPGDRLPPERDLAEMLGVSRPTLREAIRALSLLGIVRARQGSGTYLCELDEESLRAPLHWLMSLSLPGQEALAVLEFRTVIEAGLARLAAERIEDHEIELLDDLLAQLHVAPDDETLLRIDMRMHEIVATAAGSPLLHWVLSTAKEMNAAVRSRTVRAPGVREEVAADQDDIVAAMKAHDSAAAAAAMWHHLDRIRSAYRDHLREIGEE